MKNDLQVSVIVPTYKDITALDLILRALERQTYKNFEVIVAEDDDSLEVKEYLQKHTFFYPIQHYSHEDRGLRKAVAVNSAVRMANGEYLIYIDGDTIPYSTFIEAHVQLSEPKTVLCGRRVNLGDKISAALRTGKITAEEIEENYLKKYFKLHNDNTRHYNKGIYLKPNGFVHKIIACFDSNIHILASNFSCYKADMLAINGSDEAMPGGPGVDDTDVEWRMKAAGMTLKSCKYSANLLHLNHPRSDRRDELARNMQIIKEKQSRGEIVAKMGINKKGPEQ